MGAANSTIQGVALGGVTLAIFLDEAAGGLATALRVSKWTTRIAAIGGIGWLLTDPQLRAKFMKVLAPIGQMVGEVYTNGFNAARVLSSTVARANSLDGIEQRIAEIFVIHAGSEGLLALEIQKRLILQEDLEIVPTIPEIRKIIERAPCFDERRRYRYHFSRATPNLQIVEPPEI